MSEQPHILVVDDDRRIRDLTARYLSEQGFNVVTANDAADARDKMKSLAFDLLVLDIMMPGENGLELTVNLRTESDVPILLLTARTETEDRIAGLETGADDYLTKPFEPKELVLRIQSILKRARPVQRASAQRRVIKFGEFLFELDRRRLFRGEEPVYLTEAETDLLTELASRAGEVVSRDALSSSASDTDESTPDSSGSRQVDVQVTRLRRKIESDPRFPRYLQTVRGRGYLLQPD
ncbi:response regulator [Dongia sedimenti]|uniref:Response regulator transcription factor n=1 Tax=Dongia sedimenti TaxID=3064282 RepID=A0ABU0YR19_9PROT|nr:response regulator transcription factor [Rhodospirillaceae bacterium R-7]